MKRHGTHTARIALALGGLLLLGVYVQPALSLGIAFDKVGGFQFQSAVPNQRELIGSKMRTQFAGFDGKANKLGLTTSNGLDLTIGGHR